MRTNKSAIIISLIFAAFVGWWIQITVSGTENSNILNAFAGSYGVIALIGGLLGIWVSTKWGGIKTVLGRSILMFALGLLAQEFGQLAYAYFAVVKKVEIPYPSIGDAGYFGSVLLYIYAIWLAAKASGSKFSMKAVGNKVVAFLLPVILLGGSYWYFLRGYEFDWSAKLTTLLDFGYPLGQAFYLALALLAYILSKKLLGGVLKRRILLLIFALLIQYIADFNFLYQASKETWTTAGYGDLIYATSYFVMALALLGFMSAYRQISKENKQ